mmetsp:Transcript_5593/g.17654  ORF Transcript_5593/g.17654 Transcript_5593/m.17654 type:complete len:845 (-) Transcript_5593:264-2798(-)
MVPVSEMVAVASAGRGVAQQPAGSAAKKKRQSRRKLRVGAFVRVTRDKYKGDLARVVALSDGNESAVVQLVPRVASSASGQRPPQRMFVASEMIAKGHDVDSRRFRYGGQRSGAVSAARNWHAADELFDVYDGHYFRGGYLYREVTCATMLRVDDPKATLDELERFVDTTPANPLNDDDDKDDDDDSLDSDVDDADDENRLAKQRRKAERKQQKALRDQIEALARGGADVTLLGDVANQDALALDPGDRVEATGGDERGKQFVVVTISANGVCVCRPVDGGEEVPIEATRLVKSIAVGARVKVSDGRYAGQTGVVLERGELDGDHVAVVLTDAGGREITVRLAHAHESNEIAKGHDQLEGYKIHDLLQLPLGAVGVVARIDGDALAVLTSRGEIRSVQPGDVAKTLNFESTRNVSLDRNDEHVRERDVVIVDFASSSNTNRFGSFGGGSQKQQATLNKGDQATVVRAYKAFLWLQPLAAASDDLVLARARHVHVAGARSGGGAGLAAAYMGLGTRTVTENQFNKSTTGGGATQRFSKDAIRTQRDPLVSKTVRVTRGNNKGLLGTVVNATATHATLELMARDKTITVKKEHIKEVDTQLAVTEDEASTLTNNVETQHGFTRMETPFLTSKTPIHNGTATPMYGAATPLHGAMTPGRATPRAFTPSHGAATPLHGMEDDVWRPNQAFVMPPNEDPAPDDDTHDRSAATRDDSFLRETNAPTQEKHDDDEEAKPPEMQWCTPGAEALLPDGRTCRVDSLESREAVVSVKSTFPTQVLTVALSDLRRLVPAQHEKIRVVDDKQVYDAELLSIEDQDGIIKVEATGEYKIIEFVAIAKLAIDGYDNLS